MVMTIVYRRQRSLDDHRQDLLLGQVILTQEYMSVASLQDVIGADAKGIGGCHEHVRSLNDASWCSTFDACKVREKPILGSV